MFYGNKWAVILALLVAYASTQSPIEAPKDVEVTHTDTGDTIVNWNSPVLNYRVVLQLENGTIVFEGDTTSSNFTFSGLEPCTDYLLMLGARYSADVEPAFHEPIPIKTPPPSVISPILKARLTRPTITNLTLDIDDIPRKCDTIYLTKLYTESGILVYDSMMGQHQLEATFVDLIPKRGYQVSIVAKDLTTEVMSTEVLSEIAYTEPAGPPQTVSVKSVTEDSAVVSWSAPDAGEFVAEYVVGGIDSSNFGLVYTGRTREHESNVTNLRPCQKYKVAVGAKYYPFVVPVFAQSIMVATPPPNIIQRILSAELAGPGIRSIDLIFTDKARDCATHYRISLYDEDHHLVKTDEITSMSYAFVDLQPSRAYYASITAIDNASGKESEPFYTALARTEPAKPPRNFHTEDKMSDSYRLVWQVPEACSELNLIGYVVSVTLDGKVIFSDSTKELYVLVKHLIACTKYEATVAAIYEGVEDPIFAPQIEFATPTPEVTPPVEKLVLLKPGFLRMHLNIADVERTCKVKYEVVLTNMANEKTTEFTTESTDILLTDLQPDTDYTATVIVIDVIEGKQSDPVESNVERTLLPPAPKNFHASQIAAESITLDWDRPTDEEELEIVDYDLKVYKEEKLFDEITVHGESQVLTKGITPCTGYIARVGVNYKAVERTFYADDIVVSTTSPLVIEPVDSVELIDSSATSVSMRVLDGTRILTCPTVLLVSLLNDAEEVLRTYQLQELNDVIEDLQPNTYYHVSIIAQDVNSKRESEARVSNSFETRPAPAPVNFEVVRYGSDQLKVSWLSPSETFKLALVGYTLRVSLDSEIVFSKDLSRETLEYEIVDLMACTSYELEIGARYDGIILPSFAEKTMALTETPEVIAPVESISLGDATPTSLKVTIKDVPRTCMTAYVYKLTRMTDLRETIKELETADDFTIANLNPDTPYSITIWAVDEQTRKQSSPVASDVTKTLPSPPATNVRVTLAEPNTLSITWDPPMARSDLTLTHYEVIVRDQNSGEVSLRKSTGKANTIKATALKSCTGYSIEVQTFYATLANNPAISAILLATTPPPNVIPPIKKVTVKDSTSNSISFELSDEARTCAAEYVVDVIDNAAGKIEKTFTTSDEFGTIAGLKPATAYKLSVTVRDVTSLRLSRAITSDIIYTKSEGSEGGVCADVNQNCDGFLDKHPCCKGLHCEKDTWISQGVCAKCSGIGKVCNANKDCCSGNCAWDFYCRAKKD